MFKLVMVSLLLMGSIKANSMNEFDYMSKKLSSLSKTVDKSRRKKILDFIKKKTGKDPLITSKHRHNSINHELYGAVDIAGDKYSEMLMDSIGEIKGRAIDERKAKSKKYTNRNVVHFDLKTGKVKALDKMLMKMKGRKIKGNYDMPGTIRTETRQGTYPIRDRFNKAEEKKKLTKKAAVKKLTQEVSEKNKKKKRLEELKKQGLPYADFERKLREENLYE